jgi:putative DNA primase/helicase
MVLLVCQSHACCFADVVAAVGLTAADFRGVDPGTARTIREASSKSPANATDLAQLDALVTQLSDGFASSESCDYAWDRWKIDEDDAALLRLGHVHPVDNHPLMQRQFARVMGISVPLLGFDGKPRGLQRRSLFDPEDRWSTLKNPADDRVWARFGVMMRDSGDDYVLLTEGPGDGLAAYGAKQSAVFLRGSSTMIKQSVEEIIEHLADKMIVLAGDNDDAGRKFNHDLASQLNDSNIDVRILDLPEGVGDLTEWLERDEGLFPDLLLKAMRAAPPYVPPSNQPTPPAPVGDDYEFTDVGNGRRLEDWFKGNFKYSPELGRLVYIGGVWQTDILNLVPREWKKCLNDLKARASELIEYGERIGNTNLVERGEAMFGYALRCSNEPKFKHAIAMAESDATVDHSKFDKPLHLLNVANGTVDLQSGKLLPHRREDFLTHQLDVAYDTEAECPRFMQFLGEIFPGQPELPVFMQRLTGYLATGEISEQIVVTCHGTGANGKSVFWGVVASVLKDITKFTTMSTFEKRQAGAATADLAYLRGARLVLTQESDAGQAVSESTLKRVSGGDAISCRQLYRAPMSYTPQFSVIFALNHLFRIRGQDEGVWRRQILVPFSRFFRPEERDPNLLVTLIGESPGILRWIVDGAVQWYANGLDRPEVVTAATAEFRHGSDELAGFLGMVIEPDPNGEVTGAELMDRYIGWCHEENTRPWTRTSLFNGVVERVAGAKRKRKTAGISITGVSFVGGM